MNGKKWFVAWFVLVAVIMGLLSAAIIYVDPFFHYHKPHTDKFYYRLQGSRNINNGIEKHFDYDALITGTSLTENFRTSELDRLFGTNSIKVSLSGATLHEVNNNIETAVKNNPDLKMVVRCIDGGMYFDDKDKMRTELGEYPTYLYDDHLYNDVNYIFNRELLFSQVYQMLIENLKGTVSPGIDSFDAYAYWYGEMPFGANAVYPDKNIDLSAKGAPVHMSTEEAQTLSENIEANVCRLARENPQIQFYYYLSPYSAARWQQLNESGEIYKYLEAEKLVIELILSCENIRLFSVSANTDITTDLNNYYDYHHYGPWINSLILIWMSEDKFRLTEENYKDYLADLERIYTEFDYNSLLHQEDHSVDATTVEKFEQLYGYELGEY